MKIQPKVYTFERGDIVAASTFDAVAIRSGAAVDPRPWVRCYDGVIVKLADQEVEDALENGSWFYVGNRRELAQ